MHPDNFKFVFVSKEAQEFACKLVTEHKIPPGYGVASYLGLAPGYDNYSAIGVWVHKKLSNSPAEQATTFELNRAFASCFPPLP